MRSPACDGLLLRPPNRSTGLPRPQSRGPIVSTRSSCSACAPQHPAIAAGGLRRASFVGPELCSHNSHRCGSASLRRFCLIPPLPPPRGGDRRLRRRGLCRFAPPPDAAPLCSAAKPEPPPSPPLGGECALRARVQTSPTRPPSSATNGRGLDSAVAAPPRSPPSRRVAARLTLACSPVHQVNTLACPAVFPGLTLTRPGEYTMLCLG